MKCGCLGPTCCGICGLADVAGRPRLTRDNAAQWTPPPLPDKRNEDQAAERNADDGLPTLWFWQMEGYRYAACVSALPASWVLSNTRALVAGGRSTQMARASGASTTPPREPGHASLVTTTSERTRRGGATCARMRKESERRSRRGQRRRSSGPRRLRPISRPGARAWSSGVQRTIRSAHATRV